MPFFRVALLLLLCAGVALSQNTADPNLMPLPASYQPAAGRMIVDQSFSVVLSGHKEARLDRAVGRFEDQLALRTGSRYIAKPAAGAKTTLTIKTDHASKDVQAVGEDESYVLEITPAGATLTAPNPLGVIHGVETFLQLVRPAPPREPFVD